MVGICYALYSKCSANPQNLIVTGFGRMRVGMLILRTQEIEINLCQIGLAKSEYYWGWLEPTISRLFVLDRTREIEYVLEGMLILRTRGIEIYLCQIGLAKSEGNWGWLETTISGFFVPDRTREIEYVLECLNLESEDDL